MNSYSQLQNFFTMLEVISLWLNDKETGGEGEQMNTLTKQDFVNVTEGAKNKIIERLVTKYDVQAAADSARDRVLAGVQSLHLENQTMMRQSNAQRDQLWRKATAVEAQVIALRHEIQAMHITLNRLNERLSESSEYREGVVT